MAIDPDDLDALAAGPVETTSYRIVDLVRRKIGTEYVRASDTAVGKAIGVSRAAINAYKKGRDVMSQERFLDVNARFLGLPDDDVSQILIDLVTDAAADDRVRQAWETIKDAVAESVRKKALSILLAPLALIALSALPPQRVTAAEGSADSQQCILWQIARGWLRRRLGSIFQSHASVTAPAF